MSSPNAAGNKQNHYQSIVLLRWLGYGLFLLALLDLVHTLVPLNLMNPEWEFQAMGAIVERMPVPLLGLGLIFFGEAQLRNRWEFPLLKLLSWFCLPIGVLSLVVVPLVLATSMQRLTVQLDRNFGNQLSQQIEQLVATEEQLTQATREEIIGFLASQGSSLNGRTPEEARQELVEGLALARQEVSTQIQGELSRRHFALKKNAAKWLLGAVISGVVVLNIWRLTRWVRVSFKGIVPKKFRAASPR